MFSHYAFSLVVIYSEYLMTISLGVTVISEYPFAFQVRGIPTPPLTNEALYSRSDLASSSEESCCTKTAVFSTFTHTQTRGLLKKVWFEYGSSGINWSMSGDLVWYSQHLLDLSSLECLCLNNDK